MDAEKAGKIGRAFRLGMAWGKGVSMAQDDAQWITVHPNGKGANANGDPIKGRPVLIDSDTGEILGGAGGKFTGRHISAMPKGGKHEQPGAQMVINRARLKKEHPEMFAPKQNKSVGSRSDKRGKTTAAASASSYKEAAERVKQIQEQQKDIDRQIHSLVSTVDWSGGNNTPEAKQALSQIAKLRSDYAKLNDDLDSAIKERAALEKTTDHPNFTHATTGRSENEITSLAWEREQKRRHRNFMTNTFGASGSETKAAMDEAKWITVHPNGTGANANGDPIKGRPLLIDDETGSILGGMGGKGKGKKLTDFKTSRKKMTFKSSGSASKSEGTTSGAQAVTQPKTLKDALKNFRDGLKGQRVTTEHLRQAARMVDESDEGKAYKQNVSKLVQKRKEAEQRIKELKDTYTAEMSKVKEEENNAARDDPKVVEAKRKESELSSKDDQVARALNEKYPGVYDASDIYDAKQRAAYLRDKAKADEVHQEWQSAQQEVFDRQFDAVKPFKERRMRLVQQLNDELSKQASAKREAVKQTAEEAKKLFSSFNTLTPGTADEIARKIRGNATIETKKQMAAAMQCYPQAMTDKFFGEYELGRTVKRGYCNSSFGEIRLSANDYDSSKDGINLGLERTASHETAHAMEELFPKLRDMEEAYYKERTQGEKSVRLSKLLPGSGYGRDEVTRPDHFFNPYVGKDYSHDGKNAKPHFEIMSMGMEYMIHEPEVFDKDPDTRNFILGVLATGGFE